MAKSVLSYHCIVSTSLWFAFQKWQIYRKDKQLLLYLVGIEALALPKFLILMEANVWFRNTEHRRKASTFSLT